MASVNLIAAEKPTPLATVWSRNDVWSVLGLGLMAALLFFNEANFRFTDGSQFRMDWHRATEPGAEA